MTTIAQVSTAMQTVLTTAVAAVDAALDYRKRPDRAKFTASTLVQTLVWGWLAHPDATVEQLAQSAARVGVTVSPQAIDQRFTEATAALFQGVLAASMQQLITGDPVAIPLLQRFTAVQIHDSTTVSLPAALAETWAGCAGDGPTAGVKCGVQLDLLTGTLHALDLAAGRAADCRLPMQHAPLPPGGLRLADLGFYDLSVFAALSAAGGYWLSKLRTTTVVRSATQPAGTVRAFVASLGEVAQWDGWVQLGRDGQLAARLLVQRVPQEVADQRRRRIRAEARDKGRMPNADSLALAAWTILMTNVPAALLSLAEALVLTKVRWQIELLFKLWKSHGQLATWRTTKPARILCELYAKLLALVFQHWALVVGCWQYPDRSLVKAAQVVRDHAPELASAQARPERLAETLATIQRILTRTARMNPRHNQPNTYQLLLALTTQEEQA